MSATQRYGVGVAAVGRQLSYDLHTENGNRRAEYVAVKFIRQVADPRPRPRVFDFIRQTASIQLGSQPGHVMSDLRLLKIYSVSFLDYVLEKTQRQMHCALFLRCLYSKHSLALLQYCVVFEDSGLPGLAVLSCEDVFYVQGKLCVKEQCDAELCIL